MSRASRLSIPVLIAASVLLVPLAAGAEGTSESRFISYTNSARSSNGLRAYAVAGDLTSVARRWAAHMAAHHQLAHNPSYSSEVCCWTHIGENVGVGRSASSIQSAFMASSPHRVNILSTSFTQVGIGTAWGSDGRLYVDEVFRRPTHVATAPVPRAARPAPVVVHSAATTAHRASRSAVRRPRLSHHPRRPSALALFRARLAAARRASASGYVDPVGGALAYVRVVQQLTG
jgi:hypothetical protein